MLVFGILSVVWSCIWYLCIGCLKEAWLSLYLKSKILFYFVFYLRVSRAIGLCQRSCYLIEYLIIIKQLVRACSNVLLLYFNLTPLILSFHSPISLCIFLCTYANMGGIKKKNPEHIPLPPTPPLPPWPFVSTLFISLLPSPPTSFFSSIHLSEDDC